MKAVTLTAPTYQELKSLYLVRKLYVPNDVRLTPTQYSELCKRFSKGYEKMKEHPETVKAMSHVNEYTNELEMTGINDHEVKSLEFNYGWIVRKSIFSFFIFIIFVVLVFPAFVILTPFAIIIQSKAEKERLAVYFFVYFRQKRKTRIKSTLWTLSAARKFSTR